MFFYVHTKHWSLLFKYFSWNIFNIISSLASNLFYVSLSDFFITFLAPVIIFAWIIPLQEKLFLEIFRALLSKIYQIFFEMIRIILIRNFTFQRLPPRAKKRKFSRRIKSLKIPNAAVLSLARACISTSSDMKELL